MALIDPPQSRGGPSDSQSRDRPSESDVRAGLDRVLASNAFRASPQLGAFLRYVVESTLDGRGERLKGYTIGVEALGRADSFNPQIDPIVRVEAIRLRRALDRYYADDGSGDPVVIVLQRGSYAPTFAWRAAAAGPPIPPPDAGAPRTPARALLAVLLFGALVALAGLIAMPRHGGARHNPAPAATTALAPPAPGLLPPGDGMLDHLHRRAAARHRHAEARSDRRRLAHRQDPRRLRAVRHHRRRVRAASRR